MGSRQNGDQSRRETVNLCEDRDNSEYRDNKESAQTSLRESKFI